MATFASMQKARAAKKQARSKYSSSSRNYDAVDKDVMARSGLTPAQYDSLLPEARKAVMEKYASGELTSTNYSRSTARYTLPDGRETDWQGARDFEAAEKERVARELSRQLVETAVREDAQKVTAKGGYIYVEKRPSQPTIPKKGIEGFKQGFADLTQYRQRGFDSGVREYETSSGAVVSFQRERTRYPVVKSTGLLAGMRQRGFSPLGTPVSKPGLYTPIAKVAYQSSTLGTDLLVYGLSQGSRVLKRDTFGASYVRARKRGNFDTIYQESRTEFDVLSPSSYGPAVYEVWNPAVVQSRAYSNALKRGLSQSEAEDVFFAVPVERARRTVVGGARAIFAETTGEVAGRVTVKATFKVAKKWGYPVSKLGLSRVGWGKRFLYYAPGGAAGGFAEATVGSVLAYDTVGGDLTGRQVLGYGAFGAGFAGLATGGYGATQASRFLKIRRLGRGVDAGLKLYDYEEALGDELVDYFQRRSVRGAAFVNIPARASSINTDIVARAYPQTRASVRSNSFQRVQSLSRSRSVVAARSSVLARSNIASRSDIFSRSQARSSTLVYSPVAARADVNIAVPTNVQSRTTVSSRADINIPVPAGGRGLFLLPPGPLSGRRGSGGLRGSKRLLGATPSLAALELNIRGGGRSPFAGFTGFELRGLPGLSRRRRRKRR